MSKRLWDKPNPEDKKQDMFYEGSLNLPAKIINRFSKEKFTPKSEILCLGSGAAFEEEQAIRELGASLNSATFTDKNFDIIKDGRQDELKSEGATFVEGNFINFVINGDSNKYQAIMGLSIEYLFKEENYKSNEEALSQLDQFISNLFRIMKDGGVLYFSPSTVFFDDRASKAGFTRKGKGIYIKS